MHKPYVLYFMSLLDRNRWSLNCILDTTSSLTITHGFSAVVLQVTNILAPRGEDVSVLPHLGHADSPVKVKVIGRATITHVGRAMIQRTMHIAPVSDGGHSFPCSRCYARSCLVRL